MADEIESLLRLVADGRLTPEEAAPLLAALQDAADARRRPDGSRNGPASGGSPWSSRDRADDGRRGGAARPAVGRVQEALANRRIRIYVAENGRQIVNLQVPLGAAGYALDRLPGLSDEYRERISEAIRTGMTGPILEVHDEGDEVRIVIE